MAATAEYLSTHPFASPDIVNPPEAPTYRYRPDLSSTIDLAGVETVDLSAGSRIDLVIADELQTYILQAGEPTGSSLEVVPDDFSILNEQYWLLVDAGVTGTPGPISFSDISGTISFDQFPPGSVGTVDSIGENALYFFTDSTNLPSLISADATVAFLSGHISFTDIEGNISLDQFPSGSIAQLDSIGEDAIYFFDEDTFLPALISKDDALIFLLPDQTGQDGFFLQTNAGVLSWAAGSGGGSIASTTTFLMGDGAGAAVASGLSDDGAGDLTYEFDQNNQNNFEVFNATNDTAAGSALQVGVGTVLFTIGVYAALHTTAALLNGGDSWLFASGPMVIGATGAIRFANDGVTTERVRINNGLSVGSTTDPGAGNILLNGLTASVFVKTDASKILVSKTASEMRTDLALVPGTDVQVHDADLDTIAGLTATTDNFIVSVSSAWSSRTPSQVRTTLGLVIGTNVQAWDADLDAVAALATDSFGLALLTKTSAANIRTYIGAGTSSFSGAFSALSGIPTSLSGYGITDAQPLDSDLTTIAGLTATTDNFIVSVSSAWASRTPAQVLSTLAAVGTTFQPLDSDLTTIAGLTATTDNFIVSVSSAWASRTPSQVRTTLGLVIGTNVQAWDADLDTLAGLTATTDNFVVSVSSAWASRTPTQVKTTLGLTIGTNVQAWDADLDTIAGLTATTDNFIVSVSSAWASRTPSQVRTTLGLVIGTNVQAWDADLDSWAAITRASGFDTFSTTATSANLRSLLSDENGTGVALFDSNTSAIFITPVLGTPTSGDFRNCSAATDSLAGVMSAADHTTFTALSGNFGTGVAPSVPKGVMWVAQKTGIDAKSNATTDIFTVPTSMTAVIVACWLLPTTVTGGAAVAFVYKIVESGGSLAMTTATAGASTAPVTTKAWVQSGNQGGNILAVCTTGNKVQCNITTAFTTSTTVTATVFVVGYYI